MNQALRHINLIYGINSPGACHQVSSPPTGETDGLAKSTMKASKLQCNGAPRGELPSVSSLHAGWIRVLQEGAPEHPFRMERCVFAQPPMVDMWTVLTHRPSWPGAKLLTCTVCAAGVHCLGLAICCPERDLELSVTTPVLQVLFHPNQQHFHPKIILHFSTLFWVKMHRRERLNILK